MEYVGFEQLRQMENFEISASGVATLASSP
jgi:hypothetical protein